jgi:outer membrane protein assembly factor BamE (lipoprotein component of BamABCDE complex)
MRISKLLVTFLIIFILTSCTTWEIRQSRNRDNLMRIDLGMSKDQVVLIMGKPDLNEAYQTADGGALVILFYYTNRKWADGNVTKDECTPLVFENGKLIGWGDEFYQSKIKIELDIKNKQ